MSGISRGGNLDCDHDYPSKPTKEEPEFSEWTCTKCGMIRQCQQPLA